MEEVIMTLHTHPSSFPVFHTINTHQIYNTSQLVTKRTGMLIQPNKAIVGGNAFAHESGIHQDGVLKHKETYEIMQPELLGIPSNALVLGKHSGRNAFKTVLETLIKGSAVYENTQLDNPEISERLFKAFKKLADTKKKGVQDQDLIALLDEELHLSSSGPELFSLQEIQVISGSSIKATATVTMLDASNPLQPISKTDAAIGHGPVHAIFSAIHRIVGISSSVLVSYDVKAVTEGSDALGKVTVKITEDVLAYKNDQQQPEKGIKSVNLISGTTEHQSFDKGLVYQGIGTDEDILVASAKAYIQALNRFLNFKSSFSGKGELKKVPV
jgi:2-isopropylmalate synthase